MDLDLNNTTTAYPSSMSLYARYLTNKKSREARQQQRQQSLTENSSNNQNNRSKTILASSSLPVRLSPSASLLAKLSSSQRSSAPATTMATINYLRSASMLHTTLSLTILLIMSATTCQAFLYQPINYMLDDSALIDQNGNEQLDHASLSPIYNDQSGSSGITADKDIATIIGEGLARWRDARMLNHQQQSTGDNNQQTNADDQLAASNYDSNPADGQSENGPNVGEQPQSVSSAVAEMVLNGMSALASAANAEADTNNSNDDPRTVESVRSPSSIMEVDTSASSAASEVSKADLKGTRQWYNPKDNIPALRISSMATPSKHKKVYFRSEKKLTDDSMDKSSLMKPFSGFGVQRRSSRGSSSPVAPQSLFQNGVIDFLRKFREVYIQTRPISTTSGSSAASSLASAASNMMAAAASSPSVVSALTPSSSSSSSGSSSSSSSGSKPGLASAASALSSAASGSGSGLFGGASSGPNRSPLTPQKYMSFWSKQFPTWVRKVLKQIRRSTLKASQNKRQQQTSAIGQASAGSSATGVAENSAHNANH